jgi:hypothetical protein
VATTSKASDVRNRTSQIRKRDAQLQVIGYLRAGYSSAEAIKQVNRSLKAYYAWRLADDDFKLRCDQAIQAWQEQADGVKKGEQPRNRAINLDGKETEFLAWRKRYVHFDTFPHLRMIWQAMEDAGPGSITMILMPPEWMKTTFLEDYITHSISVDPNDRILALSEGQDHARKMIGRIERRLETDGTAPDLVAHFGPFKDPTSSKPWNADFFTVLGSDHDERDYTLESAGIKSTIRGGRYRKIILDDIQSQRSLSETKRFVAIFRDDVITRPGQDGRIFIIGSRVGNNDVYEALLEEEGLIDALVILPALDLTKPVGQQSNFPPQFNPDGTPLVDAKGQQIGWSDEALARRRQKVGEDIWAQVYMQSPKSAAGALVTEEDILRATDSARAIGETHGLEAICSLDPALARHAAFMACEFDANALYVIEPVDMYQPRRNEVLLAEVDRLTGRYHPTTWVIENNTLQSGFLVDDRFLEIQATRGFRSIGQHTGSAKTDPMYGIPAMMNAIIRREIRFPGRGSGTNPALILLFDQLIKWRPDVLTKYLPQDMVMALFFAWKIWRELRERSGVDLSAWTRGALTGAPSGWQGASHLRTENGTLVSPERPRPRTYEEVWSQLTSGGIQR